jgi:FkbM family methyltransferase
LNFNGEKIVVDNTVSFSAFLNLAYGCILREDVESLVDRLGYKEGDIFIDLGANLGQEVEPMSDAGMEVHAFEPHPLMFSFLELKNSDRENLTLLNAAASNFYGNAEFFFKNNDRQINGGASLVREKNGFSSSKTVECIDIASYIKGLGRRVRFLKIDVEGSEYDLLQRLVDEDVLGDIDYILLEDHSDGIFSRSWIDNAVKAVLSTKKYPCSTKILLWYGPIVEDERFVRLHSELSDMIEKNSI